MESASLGSCMTGSCHCPDKILLNARLYKHEHLLRLMDQCIPFPLKVAWDNIIMQGGVTVFLFDIQLKLRVGQLDTHLYVIVSFPLSFILVDSLYVKIFA